jgi:hypothetical protein
MTGLKMELNHEDIFEIKTTGETEHCSATTEFINRK